MSRRSPTTRQRSGPVRRGAVAVSRTGNDDRGGRTQRDVAGGGEGRSGDAGCVARPAGRSRRGEGCAQAPPVVVSSPWTAGSGADSNRNPAMPPTIAGFAMRGLSRRRVPDCPRSETIATAPPPPPPPRFRPSRPSNEVVLAVAEDSEQTQAGQERPGFAFPPTNRRRGPTRKTPRNEGVGGVQSPAGPHTGFREGRKGAVRLV